MYLIPVLFVISHLPLWFALAWGSSILDNFTVIHFFFQTTVALLAVLSAGAKTIFYGIPQHSSSKLLNVYVEEDLNNCNGILLSIILKLFNFHVSKALHWACSTCSNLHHRLHIFLSGTSNFFALFVEVYWRRKPVSRSIVWLLESGWLVGFVALRPKSTAMVIAGRSVHLTTLFPGQAWTSD